jgi:CheY-like chemotaxis protein
MGRFLDANGKATDDEAAAAINPQTKKPGENGLRNLWVNEPRWPPRSTPPTSPRTNSAAVAPVQPRGTPSPTPPARAADVVNGSAERDQPVETRMSCAGFARSAANGRAYLDCEPFNTRQDRRSVMRVLIVEPDPSLRAALREALALECDLVVTAEQTFAGAHATARLDQVDVILVDERIAGGSTSATRAALQALARHALVVVIGDEPGHQQDLHVEAGAVGYWRTHDDVRLLIPLVRAAALVAQADRACVAQRRRRVAWFQRRFTAPMAVQAVHGAPDVR